MSAAENIAMLKKIQESDFSGITELNLSCPNVPGKPQLAYDFEATEKLLKEVFTFFTKPLGVKLPLILTLYILILWQKSSISFH